MLTLRELWTKEDADLLVLYHDGTGRRVLEKDAFAPGGKEGTPVLPRKGVEEIRVYLRPLLGRDSRQIADLMIRVDDNGKSSMRSGAAAREKVVLATVAIEGVANAERITREVYDRLPAWITETILERINATNQTPKDIESGE